MHGARTKLLIVEDDAATSRFLADNLAADGYDVVTAGGVGESVRAIESRSPSLVVLDLGLEDGSGLSVLDRVRSADGLSSRIDPALPVVVLSGRSGEADRVRGFARGADDYLVKPFSYAELLGRVRAVLRRADARSARGTLRVGDLTLDPVTRAVRLGGRPLESVGQGVRAAPPARRGSRARLHQARAAARRLGLRRDGQHPHARRPRLPAAQEAGRGRRPAVGAQRARRGLPAHGGAVSIALPAVAGWALAGGALGGVVLLRRRLRLVARAEHELRGPVTVLSLTTERLRRDRASEHHAFPLESELARLCQGLRRPGRRPARRPVATGAGGDAGAARGDGPQRRGGVGAAVPPPGTVAARDLGGGPFAGGHPAWARGPGAGQPAGQRGRARVGRGRAARASRAREASGWRCAPVGARAPARPARTAVTGCASPGEAAEGAGGSLEMKADGDQTVVALDLPRRDDDPSAA